MFFTHSKLSYALSQNNVKVEGHKTSESLHLLDRLL